MWCNVTYCALTWSGVNVALGGESWLRCLENHCLRLLSLPSFIPLLSTPLNLPSSLPSPHSPPVPPTPSFTSCVHPLFIQSPSRIIICSHSLPSPLFPSFSAPLYSTLLNLPSFSSLCSPSSRPLPSNHYSLPRFPSSGNFLG